MYIQGKVVLQDEAESSPDTAWSQRAVLASRLCLLA